MRTSGKSWTFYFSVFVLLLCFPYSIKSSTNFDGVQRTADFLLQDMIDKYSDYDSNEFWHSYTLINNENREVVRIEKVEKNTIQGKYLAWKHAELGPKNYLVGLSKHSLDLYGSNLRKISSVGTTETFVALTVFTRWNNEISSPELFAFVATAKPSIEVYKVINEDITKLPDVWDINYQIERLEFAHTGPSYKLIISPVQESLPIAVYNFAVNGSRTQLWFHQRFPINGKASSTVFDIGQISTIAIATQRIINIYSFDFGQAQYVLSQYIPLLAKSRQLVSFTFVYQHYLASVPAHGSIEFFSVSTNEFVREDSFGQIEAVAIHAVSIEDYSNEPVIVVQQNDGQIWFLSIVGKGKALETGFDCTSSKALCSSKADLAKGANFLLNGTALYILPTEKSGENAETFIISKQVHETASPEYQQSMILSSEYESLNKQFAGWNRIVAETREILENSLSLESSNTITGSWRVNRLRSQEVIMEEDQLSSELNNNSNITIYDQFGKFQFVDTQWILADFGITFSDIDRKINDLRRMEEDVLRTLQDSVPLNSDKVHVVQAKQKISAIFRTGKLTASEIQLSEINRQQNINNFLKNIVKKEDDLFIKDSLTFRGHLSVDDLRTETLGTIKVSDIAQLSEQNNFRCKIHFSTPFKVEGNVHSPNIGGIQLSTEVIKAKEIQGVKFLDGIVALKEATISSPINSVEVQNVTFEDLLLKSTIQTISARYLFKNLDSPNNFPLKILNGQNFNGFMETVVFPEFYRVIRGEKKVIGKVTAKSLIIENELNNIPFPDGFVSDTNSVISGRKTFFHITANTVSLEGRINNITTNDLVSARNHATLNKKWTFKDSVTFLDDLEVKNHVDGVKIESLKHLDTLEEAQSTISYYPNADIEFKQPVHFESLTIDSTINRKSFNELFGILLLLDSSVTRIKGVTTFNQDVTFDALQLNSGQVNNMKLDEFFTLNTPQNISGTKILENSAVFTALYSLGKFDSVQLSELFKDVFKLSETRTISSKFFFKYISCGSKMKVSGQINNFKDFASEVALIRGSENQVFQSTVEFEDFQVKTLHVTDLQIAAGNTIDGLDIHSWNLNRISLNKDATISAPFELIGTATVFGNILTDKINGVRINHLTSGVLRSDRDQQTFLESTKFTGLVTVENGHIEFKRDLSGISLIETIANAFHTRSSTPEVIDDTWHFQSIVVKENLSVLGNTCHVNLRKLDADSVRKGESDIHIAGSKTFKGKFEVKHSLTVTDINSVDYFTNIFTLNTTQDVTNEFLFKKNVFVNSLIGDWHINGISITELSRIYSYNDGTHTLHFDVEFKDSIESSHLSVSKLIQMQDFSKFITTSVARKTQMRPISGTKTFKQTISIEGNLEATTLNNINLNQFFARIIRKTNSLKFNHPVFFQNQVEAPDLIIEFGDLQAPDIIGDVNLTNLVSKAVYINRKLVKATLTFDSCTIVKNIDDVVTLNGVLLKDVITLNQRHHIENLRVREALFNGENVEVGGLVSGFDIRKEFENSLWSKSETTQWVIGSKIFENHITFKRNLNCHGKKQNKISLLNENIISTSRANFLEPIHIVKDLTITRLVNGQSFQEMLSNGLTNGDEEITGLWTFKGGVTFKKDVGGQGQFNGFELSSIISEKLSQIKEEDDNIEKEVTEYEKACSFLDSLHFQTSKNPVILHSLDLHQTIMSRSVSKMITIMSNGNLHLVTSSDSCEVKKYEWTEKTELFEEKLSNFRLGNVINWNSFSFKNKGFLAYAVKQSHDGKCSFVSSGIYAIILNTNGEYSLTLSVKKGDFTEVSLVENEGKLALFALNDDLITVSIFFYDEEKERFVNSKEIKLASSALRFKTIAYKNGVAIFHHCQEAVHVTYFSFITGNSDEIGKTFITSNDSRTNTMVIFNVREALYGIVQTENLQESIIEPDCTLQVFQFDENGLRKFQRLKSHRVTGMSTIKLGEQLYIGILSDSFGLTTYKFLGLGGIEPFNENPITVQDGTGLISFAVDAWDSEISPPFLAVSRRGAIDIFHSNIQGDRAKYTGKSDCKVV